MCGILDVRSHWEDVEIILETLMLVPNSLVVASGETQPDLAPRVLPPDARGLLPPAGGAQGGCGRDGRKGAQVTGDEETARVADTFTLRVVLDPSV